MEGIAFSANPDPEALNELLDVFGSKFSLEDIASAYYEAKGNVNITGEILCSRIDRSALSAARADTNENQSVGARANSVESLSGLESDSAVSSEYTPTNPNTGALNSKRCSASMGSVSGVIGQNYVNPRPSRKDFPETTKPMKIDSNEFPSSLIWSEENPSRRTTRNDTRLGDLEEFLFEMLGDGFQLDNSVIHKVLGSSGFDVEKSMDKLLDLSASTLEKSDDVIGIATEKFTGKSPDEQYILIQDKPQSKDSEEMASMIRIPKRSSRRNKDIATATLEKEVLETLFTVPERSEEAEKRTPVVRVVRRSRNFGELVTKPLKDSDVCLTSVVEVLKVSKNVEDGHDDDENSYDVLRQAVKEYWIAMKEYFKASVEAFAEGDKARAKELMERGQFFNKKAREADERSSKKILETSCSDDEIISLDLRNFEPKEALNLLRVHLTNFSGISSIKYLRIIVGTIEEDTKKGARRRLIMKQLDKESIKWKEEENGRILSIRVDEIKPNHLSFAKKKNQNETSLKSAYLD